VGRLHTTEREARIKRVWDLRKTGLSMRDIQVQLLNEGYQISVPQVKFDIDEMTKREEVSTKVPPFWCFNKTVDIYPNCCFNHKVGMPSPEVVKLRKQVPQIFDYQMDLFMDIEKWKRLLYVKSRKIGATEILKRAALYYALYGFTKGFQTIIIPGTREKLSLRHVQDIRLLLERGGYEEMIVKEKSTKDQLFLSNGSEILGFPSNPSAARGYQNIMLVLVDEAALFDMRDEEQSDVVNSLESNLAHSNGNMTMISSPKGRRGVFYEAYMEKSDHWHKVHIPYHIAMNKVISQEFIEEQKKSDIFNFEQEFLCRFSTTHNSVYTKPQIESAKGDYRLLEFGTNEWRIDGKFQPDRAIGGLDLAVTQDFTAFVVLAKEKDKPWRCILLKLYNPSHWPTILEEVAKYYKEFNMEDVGIDTTALGKGFADFVIAKQMRSTPINFSMQIKQDMINHNKKLFQSHELEFPRSGCQELDIQFEEQMQTDSGANVKFDSPAKRHDDAFWAWHIAAKLIGETSETVCMLLS